MIKLNYGPIDDIINSFLDIHNAMLYICPFKSRVTYSEYLKIIAGSYPDVMQ
jgi:hypothetical protein